MQSTTAAAPAGTFAAVFPAARAHAPSRPASLVARVLQWPRDRRRESQLALIDARLLEDAGITLRRRHPDWRD